MGGSIALGMAPRDISDLDVRKRIAGWLEYHRRKKNWTQADLARAMGKPEGTVSRVLSGGRGAGLDVIAAMRYRLHMELDTVFDRPPPVLPEDRPLRSLPRRPRIASQPAPSSHAPATRSGSGR